MTRRDVFAIVSVVVALAAACSGGDDPAAPDAAPCDLDVQWGAVRDAGFAPFVGGDTAELTLGFQGFRYVASALRVVGAEAGERASVTFQVELDGREPYALAAAYDVPPASPDGAHYVANVLVFFNDIPLPQLVGTSALITTRVAVGACRGSYAATVTLVDDEDCIEQPDGGLACE